jgi:hypothetical protein
MIFVTLLALIAAAGAFLVASRQNVLRHRVERDAVLERAILRAAMHNRGRVTAVDVETRGEGTLAEVEDRLRSLYAQGHCESEVTHDGRHVYLFTAYDDSQMRIAAVQKQIFLQAKIHGGFVDLTKTSMLTELTYQQVRDVLEAMVEDGLCRHADEPAVYWFPSLSARERVALPPGGEEDAPQASERQLRLASAGKDAEGERNRRG